MFRVTQKYFLQCLRAFRTRICTKLLQRLNVEVQYFFPSFRLSAQSNSSKDKTFPVARFGSTGQGNSHSVNIAVPGPGSFPVYSRFSKNSVDGRYNKDQQYGYTANHSEYEVRRARTAAQAYAKVPDYHSVTVNISMQHKVAGKRGMTLIGVHFLRSDSSVTYLTITSEFRDGNSRQPLDNP